MIKPIETTYRGVTYRSRTEARWAVFFDLLKVPYAYEPQGIDLDGDWYLPDFWLPTGGVWFEVKGVAPDPREIRVAKKLAMVSRCPVAIAVGTPPTRERNNVLVFGRNAEPDEAAITEWGGNVFLSNTWASVMIPLVGRERDLGGIPEQPIRIAKLAEAERFGVHS